MPPVIRSKPRSCSAAASAFAFATIWLPYSRNSGVAASFSATPMRGDRVVVRPALQPGKTALSIASACSLLAEDHAPRGPRSVLCVVVITTSAYGDRVRVRAGDDEAGDVRDVGEEVGADLLRDLAEPREVELRGYAVAPATMICGRSRLAPSRAPRRSR